MLATLLLALLLSFSKGAATAGDAPTTATLRVIAGSPNIAEMIFALGAGNQVVGVSTYTEFPPEAAALPAVMDLFSPNFEAILRLKPDLVFLLREHEKARAFLQENTRAEVVTMPAIENFEQISAALTIIGARLERESEARTLVERHREAVAAVGAGGSDAPRPRVLFVIGYGTGLTQLYAVGHDTYLHELLVAAGGENVLAPEMGRYPVLDKETLVRMNPDVILRVASPGQGEALRSTMEREWRVLPTLAAVRNNRLRVVEASGMMIPGPRAHTFIEPVSKAIHE